MSRSDSDDTFKIKDPARYWILLGILFASILAGPMHFIYEWAGSPAWVGIWAPVNESVWEHQKLAFLPLLLWWFISYYALKKKLTVSPARWILSCTAAQLVCPAFIIAFYYVVTGALGIHSLLLDISSLFMGLILAQFTALHIYRYAKLYRNTKYLALFVLLLMMSAFVLFTFAPPHLPLFLESGTGSYGI